jgi:hypothetical protein
MGDRSGSFLGCAQVRTKVCRKDYGWSVGLVCNPRVLQRHITIAQGKDETFYGVFGSAADS